MVRTILVGDELYGKDYSGRNKWIPVKVKEIKGPLSYEVIVEDTGQILQCHVDELRFRHVPYVLPSTEKDEFDFGPSIPCPTIVESPPVNPSVSPVV